MSSLLQQLRQRGRRYWLIQLGFLVAAWFAGHYVAELDMWDPARYWLHQRMSELAPRRLEPRESVVVLIGDEEFWKGELEARIPIKRDYLAKLTRALDEANVRVIALDIDFRAPDPSISRDHARYEAENGALVTAIGEVSSRRPVVLSSPLWEGRGGDYIVDATILDAPLPCQYRSNDQQIVGALSPSSGPRDLRCGYIALPRDMRSIPPRLPLQDGRHIDSFSQAVVAAAGRSHGAPAEVLLLNFGSYIPAEAWVPATISASAVLNDPARRRTLAHKIVFVGAGWSRLAFSRGDPVDTYASPAGQIPGVFIHANFVEALLDARVYPVIDTCWPIPLCGTAVVEFLVAVSLALVMALKRLKVVKAMAVGIACALILAASYILLHNFGRAFDGASLVIGIIAGHSIQEWLSE